MSEKPAGAPPQSCDSTARSPFHLAQRVQSYRAGGASAWEVHYAAVERQANGDDVIILTIGDPDFDTPEPIAHATIVSLKRGETHYTPAQGIPELGRAIAETETHRLGRALTEKNIVVTQGAQNALYALMQCLVNPGDEVISIDPAYPTFSGVIGGAGGEMMRAPLAYDGVQFRLDFSAIERVATARTRVLLLNFPHNPTGASIDEKEAREVAEFCCANKIWLICDEVYAELCFDKAYVSPASFAEHAGHIFAVRSFSKSHAMTGWRVGWVVAPEFITSDLQNLMNCMLFGGAAFIQRGAVAALDIDVATEMRKIYQRRRDLIFGALSNHSSLKPIRPESGIFMLVDVRGTGITSDDYAWRLLKEHNVAVLPADSFSPLTQGFVRISLCTSDSSLAEAGRRMVSLATALSNQ